MFGGILEVSGGTQRIEQTLICLGFYARCGAVDTGWTEHLFDAWFRVLVLPAEGETLDAETANKELADCYSRVMGADKWRRYVQLYRPDGTEEKF